MGGRKEGMNKQTNKQTNNNPTDLLTNKETDQQIHRDVSLTIISSFLTKASLTTQLGEEIEIYHNYSYTPIIRHRRRLNFPGTDERGYKVLSNMLHVVKGKRNNRT